MNRDKENQDIPIPSISPEIASRCTASDQADKMDRALRAVLSVSRATLLKREAEWKNRKRKRAKK